MIAHTAAPIYLNAVLTFGAVYAPSVSILYLLLCPIFRKLNRGNGFMDLLLNYNVRDEFLGCLTPSNHRGFTLEFFEHVFLSSFKKELNVETQPTSLSISPSVEFIGNAKQTIQPSDSTTKDGVDLSSSSSSSSNVNSSDPQYKQTTPVDNQLLQSILELGFEEPLILLALSKTKGIGGVEAAVSWILERSNDSDIESEVNDNMGGFLSGLQDLEPHKMVFVVNMALKMRTGKVAAQVGHATLGVYRCAQRAERGQQALDAWRAMGEAKIVVKGENTDHLLELFKQAKDAGLFAYIVCDAGRTQIPAGSRTVLSIFGPSKAVDTISGSLKLL